MEEVYILWTSEGMSCDGDSVSMTAAMQPSIEEVVLGVIPGLPRAHLHNKVLAYETGEEFMQAFHQTARGELEPILNEIGSSICSVGDPLPRICCVLCARRSHCEGFQ